ncbi:MAG: QcrA and Rieske domain-containing protein [Planctomycetota bacterium]|jgi:cytochrome b6-f complex iron-sulfur subunit
MMDEKSPTRRGFLDLILGIGSAITGMALTFPAIAYFWPAAKGGGSDRVAITGADKIPVGGSMMIQVGPQAVVVIRQRDGFKAYSAVCTHLGCLVKWDGQAFLCPCHAAKFGDDGSVLSGPPPEPLAEYRVSEIDDQVFVSPA